MTDAWLSAGSDAKDIFLIQQLEEVLETVVDRVKGSSVSEVVLLDSGDGSALPTYISQVILQRFVRSSRNFVPLQVWTSLASCQVTNLYQRKRRSKSWNSY